MQNCFAAFTLEFFQNLICSQQQRSLLQQEACCNPAATDVAKEKIYFFAICQWKNFGHYISFTCYDNFWTSCRSLASLIYRKSFFVTWLLPFLSLPLFSQVNVVNDYTERRENVRVLGSKRLMLDLNLKRKRRRYATTGKGRSWMCNL